MSGFIDLKDKQFNMLKVIRRVEDKVYPCGNRGIRWECKCDCGEFVTVTGANLRNHHSKSCGCLRTSTNPNVVIRGINSRGKPIHKNKNSNMK